LFGKAENAITRCEKKLHGVNEPLVFSVLLKADEGVRWVIRGKTWHRRSCVVTIVYAGVGFVSIGGGRSPAFILEIIISRIISAMENCINYTI
jgi:hypothetical protein